MIVHDDSRRELLHNANAVAAALDEAAEGNRLAAAAIRRAMSDPSSKAARHRGVLLPLTVRIEQLAASLSSWAALVSEAAAPVARGDDLDLLLPKMLEFLRAAQGRLSSELSQLEGVRDDLRSSAAKA